MVWLQELLELFSQQSFECREFEEAQLLFNKAATFEEWWDCLCLAASRLHFEKLPILLKRQDGTEKHI